MAPPLYAYELHGGTSTAVVRPLRGATLSSTTRYRVTNALDKSDPAPLRQRPGSWRTHLSKQEVRNMSVDEVRTPAKPMSPDRAYAALCGLSTIAEPTFAQRKRMRELARYLRNAVDDALVGELVA